jgi:hypothetical protein
MLNLLSVSRSSILLLMLLCVAPVASAGSRGYYLAFVDISSARHADGVEVMLALRQAERVEGRASCWACEMRGDAAGIAILYVRKLPAGVDGAAVKVALSRGGASLTGLQKRLREFSDEDGTRLDGLYAYERGEGMVTVHAIAPREGTRVTRFSQAVKGRIGAAELDALLERAAKGFPFVP